MKNIILILLLILPFVIKGQNIDLSEYNKTDNAHLTLHIDTIYYSNIPYSSVNKNDAKCYNEYIESFTETMINDFKIIVTDNNIHFYVDEILTILNIYMITKTKSTVIGNVLMIEFLTDNLLGNNLFLIEFVSNANEIEYYRIHILKKIEDKLYTMIGKKKYEK